MDVEAFIESAPWRFAKTMPHIPHWYVMRWEVDEADFERFVRHIRQHGYKDRFGRRTYVYLDVGEWKYWTMGAPVERTKVINRARRGGEVDAVSQEEALVAAVEALAGEYGDGVGKIGEE